MIHHEQTKLHPLTDRIYHGSRPGRGVDFFHFGNLQPAMSLEIMRVDGVDLVRSYSATTLLGVSIALVIRNFY